MSKILSIRTAAGNPAHIREEDLKHYPEAEVLEELGDDGNGPLNANDRETRDNVNAKRLREAQANREQEERDRTSEDPVRPDVPLEAEDELAEREADEE